MNYLPWHSVTFPCYKEMASRAWRQPVPVPGPGPAHPVNCRVTASRWPCRGGGGVTRDVIIVRRRSRLAPYPNVSALRSVQAC